MNREVKNDSIAWIYLPEEWRDCPTLWVGNEECNFQEVAMREKRWNRRRKINDMKGDDKKD